MADDRPELTHADLETGFDAIVLVLAEIVKELPPPLPDRIQEALARHAQADREGRRAYIFQLFLETSDLNSVIFRRFLQHRQSLLED